MKAPTKAGIIIPVAITLILLGARTVFAYPYELYARYVVPDPVKARIQKTITIQIDLSGGNLIPIDPIDAVFEGIFLKTKDDQFAKVELSHFGRLLVDVCEDAQCSKILEHNAIDEKVLHDTASREIKIFPLKPLGKNQATAPIRIEVRPKFTATFLCEQEQQFRSEAPKRILLEDPIARSPGDNAAGGKAERPKANKSPEVGTGGKPRGATRSAPAGLGTSPPKRAVVTIASNGSIQLDALNASILKRHDDGAVSLLAYTTLFERGLELPNGEPIIYSFCKDIYDEIDWEAVAGWQGKLGRTNIDADTVHTERKVPLAAKVASAIKDLGGSGTVKLEKRETDLRDNVYGYLSHDVTLLQDISDLDFFERNEWGVFDLGTVTDKNSEILLRVRPGSRFCSNVAACNTVIGSKLVVDFAYKDAKGNDVLEHSPLANSGNGWTVDGNVSDNIGQELTFTLAYAADGDAHLGLLSRKTTVEYLGLVMTFPGVAEITAIVNKDASNPADISTQSTIPISWAVNLAHGEAAHLAVTLPWEFGWNTRRNPNLAKFFKVFAAVSGIFPLTDQAHTHHAEMAAGVGVAIASAFTFSVASTFRDNPQPFLLIGFSAPDLVKAFGSQ